MPLFRNIPNPVKDFCAVSFDAYQSEPALELDNAFTQILFSEYENYSITDNGSNYNEFDNVYVVPKSGYYQVITNFRFNDGIDPIGFGQGAHTSNTDNPYFLWSYTNPNRQGSINVRATYFDALDEIRMIAYADGDPTVFIRGAMTIIPLGI